jgi:hypothetical protein
MAKPDYTKHQALYLKALGENPKLTVKQYCENAGLKYASARRYLRKPDKEVIKSAQSKKVNDEHKEKRDRAKRTPAQAKWASHVRNFLSRAIKNPSLSMTAFAQENGLSTNSFRRELAKLRGAADFDRLFDLFDEKLSTYRAIKNEKPSKSRNKSTGKAGRGKSPKASNREQTSNEGEVEDLDHAHPEDDAPTLDDVGLGKDDLVTRFSHFSAARFESTQNKKQEFNRAIGPPQMRHGGYTSGITLVSEMLDILTEVDPLSVADELLTARARYYRMNKWLSDEVDRIQGYIDRGEPLMIGTGEDAEEVDLNRVMKELTFAYEPRLAELERSIVSLVGLENKRQFDHRKQLIEEMKMPHYLPAEETALIVQLLELRERNGWDALTTAKNIERLGAKVPAALLLELKDEIENAEPEILEGEVSPEEFERRQLEYFEGLEERESQKAKEKQKELDALFEEFSPDNASAYDALPPATEEDE